MFISKTIFCLILFCSCFPLSCFAENKDFYDIRNGKEVTFVLFDNLIGYHPKANSTVRAVRTIDSGEVVYDAVYSIDAFGRRKTPVEHAAQRDEFMLCFGCSIMFGEGVNDNETLPYYLARLMPGYVPYNYAYSGYGPQEMLAKLQSSTIVSEVKEQHGIGVYVFIDNHINRAIGSMQVAGTWGDWMPYYTVEKNNMLVRKGHFISGRYFTTALYQKIMSNKALSRVINWHRRRDFPPITNKDVTVTCRIIEESRDVFKKEFNSDDFYVVLFGESPHADRIIRFFRSKGIKYLDYQNFYENGSEGYSIKKDGHPTAIAYKKLAAMIARDIALEKKVVTEKVNNTH